MQSSSGVKMLFPVRRKQETSRSEFIAFWFAHHMPVTIAAMAGRGRGYIGTVFDSDPDTRSAWDGIAQMFLSKRLNNPPAGFGAEPVDSFHERIEPYFGWPTREFVVVPGSGELPVRPLTLSVPYPTSRSGFFKVVTFFPRVAGASQEALQSRWLDKRAPAIAEALQLAGGFRYTVSISMEPNAAPYAGMEELYFHDESAWRRFEQADPPNEALDEGTPEERQQFFSDTEFIGIPP